jgi:hypothetical protein
MFSGFFVGGPGISLAYRCGQIQGKALLSAAPFQTTVPCHGAIQSLHQSLPAERPFSEGAQSRSKQIQFRRFEDKFRIEFFPGTVTQGYNSRRAPRYFR